MDCPSDATPAEEGRFHLYGDPTRPVNPCRFQHRSYYYFGYAMPDTVIYADPSLKNDPENALNSFNGDWVGAFWFRVGPVPSVMGSVPSYDILNDRPLTIDNDATEGSVTLYRLREGIERFFITDINNPAASSVAQSDIWVYYDVVLPISERFNHVPGGGNILYMDGHVEFIRYPGDGPYSRAQAEQFNALVLIGG
jgi:prepilin-type processing-associated H-X9-DG protein